MRLLMDEAMGVGWCVGSLSPPRKTLTLIVKQFYALAPGVLKRWEGEPPFTTGDVFQDDNPAGSVRYANDLVWFKPRADVMFVGSAQLPGGEMTGMLQAELRVGNLRKQAAVFGDREWTMGGVSAPKPFRTMPIAYERALGGASWKKNPVGRGRPDAKVPLPPNIEDPRRLVTSKDATVEPAGFGPLAATWEPRASMVGTKYGDDYVKTRWPWYAADFDPGYFNAAPRDQQVEGYLRGDEEIVLVNLRPEAKEYRTRLPGRRGRCVLVERREGAPERLIDVDLKLDTLWIDGDAGCVALVWRGLIDAPSFRMKEIIEVHATTEGLAEPRAAPADVRARMLAAAEAADADPPEVAAFEAAAMAQAAKAEADARASLKEAEAVKAEAAKARPPGAPVPPPPPAVGASLSALAASLRATGKPEDAAKAAELEVKAAKAEEAEAMAAAYAPLTREQVEARARSGETLAQANMVGLDLSGLDLGGANLTGALLMHAKLNDARLAGAVLKDALMYEADLTGADLTGADISGATLLKAVLKGAKIGGMTAADAMLVELSLAGMDFSGWRAAGADFTKADLTGAKFDGGVFDRASFAEATLVNASFVGASLRQTDMDGARCEGAVFDRADMTEVRASLGAGFRFASLVGVRADRGAFAGAVLDGAEIADSSMIEAVLTEASLRETLLRRVNLEGAEMSDTYLKRTHLDGCGLVKALLPRANMEEAQFSGCDAYGAGLWEALHQRATFKDTNLKGTMLA